MDFDTERYSLKDLVTGEVIEDEKARALMAYWVLEERERDIKKAKEFLIEEFLQEK